MTDTNAHNPAGLDILAGRYENLANDSIKLVDYWQKEAIEARALQADSGLPGLFLPRLNDLTPSVQQQSSDLKTHIMQISTALSQSAEMYRTSEEDNTSRAQSIWDKVDQGTRNRGETSGSAHYQLINNNGFPSEAFLTTPPVGNGNHLWEVNINIANLCRDLKAESITLSWLDNLIGLGLGENPLEKVGSFFAGNWKALDEIADIFAKFGNFTALMRKMMCHEAKGFKQKAEWEGSSADAAQTRIFGSAHKLDGLERVWGDASIKYDAWSSTSYVLLKQVESLLGLLLDEIIDVKRIFNKCGDAIAVGLDMIAGIFTGENWVFELIKELFSLAIAILNTFFTIIEVGFLILQGFITCCGVLATLLTKNFDLGKDW